VEKNKKTSRESKFENWSFKKINYILFFCGLGLIIFGYIFMKTGEVNSFQSLTLAPIMLFIGYLIVIPLSILIRK